MLKMGKRIKERRMYFNYTLDELAERTGISKSTISKMENGKLKTINRSYIDKLANVLDCEASWLMHLEDAPVVQLSYSAPGKETINLTVDSKPIIGEAGLRAKLYKAALDVAPENVSVAIELLKSLAKGVDDNAPK